MGDGGPACRAQPSQHPEPSLWPGSKPTPKSLLPAWPGGCVSSSVASSLCELTESLTLSGPPSPCQVLVRAEQRPHGGPGWGSEERAALWEGPGHQGQRTHSGQMGGHRKAGGRR